MAAVVRTLALALTLVLQPGLAAAGRPAERLPLELAYRGPIFDTWAGISSTLADADGDGVVDLLGPTEAGLLATGGTVISLRRGRGDGSFGALETILNGGGVSFMVLVADLNGDGIADVLTPNRTSDDVSVMLGLGGGRFAPARRFPTGLEPESAAVGDLNNDGRPDIAVANTETSDVTILLNRGGGEFASLGAHPTGAFEPNGIALADFDRDGNLDVATGNQVAFVSVLLGRGDGSFAAPILTPTGGPTIDEGVIFTGDFNEDGIADIVGGQALLLGDGTGAFQLLPIFAPPRFVTTTVAAVAELNGDGHWDLLAVQDSGPISLLDLKRVVVSMLGDGEGRFREASRTYLGHTAHRLTVGDVNGDGNVDVATPLGHVALGRGDGSFVSVPTYRLEAQDLEDLEPPVRALELADVDGDDRPEVLTIDADRVRIFAWAGGESLVERAPYAAGRKLDALAVADLDRDGAQDLVAGAATQLLVARNAGDGSFVAQDPVQLPGDVWAIKTIPGAGSSPPRFVVAHSGPGLVVLAPNAAGALFPLGEIGFAHDVKSIAISDIDGDGEADVLIGAGVGNGGGVYLARGSGAELFDAPRQVFKLNEGFALNIEAADLDRDGAVDLVVGQGFVTFLSLHLKVFGGMGDGSFAESPAAEFLAPVNVALADFNRDGVLDIVTGDGGSGRHGKLHIGRGDLTFEVDDPPGVDTGNGPVKTADLNLDGQPDIAVAADIGLRVFLSRGLPDPIPTPLPTLTPTPTPTPTATRAPCTADCDSDGTVEISELVRCVQIALGGAIEACPACDDDGDGRPSIAELTRGVRNAIRGCPD